MGTNENYPTIEDISLTGVPDLTNRDSKDKRRGNTIWEDLGDTCLIHIDV